MTTTLQSIQLSVELDENNSHTTEQSNPKIENSDIDDNNDYFNSITPTMSKRRRRRRRHDIPLQEIDPSDSKGTNSEHNHSNPEKDIVDSDDSDVDRQIRLEKHGNIRNVIKRANAVEESMYSRPDSISGNSSTSSEHSEHSDSSNIYSRTTFPTSHNPYLVEEDNVSDLVSELSTYEDFSQLSELYQHLKDLVSIWHALALTTPNVADLTVPQVRDEMNERGWAVRIPLNERERAEAEAELLLLESVQLQEELQVPEADDRSELNQLNFYELLAESSKRKDPFSWEHNDFVQARTGKATAFNSSSTSPSTSSSCDCATTTVASLEEEKVPGAVVEENGELSSAIIGPLEDPNYKSDLSEEAAEVIEVLGLVGTESSAEKRAQPSVSEEPPSPVEEPRNPVEETPAVQLGPSEDTLVLEMVEDFLSACSPPILHLIFIDYAEKVPQRFMDKFSKLFKLSIDAEPRILFALGFALWRDVVDVLPFENGPWEQDVTCCVCFQELSAFRRLCCNSHVCEGCLKQYLHIKVEQEGKISVPCPNVDCSGVVYRQEVVFRLSPEAKKKFDIFWVNASTDPKQKTCPRCSHITKMSSEEKKIAHLERKRVWRKRTGVNVTCPDCQLVWCFECHCPDHNGRTCKSQRKGEKQLKEWANVWTNSQRNARRCPKCKVLTQRTEGCPHMDCTKCNTSWCYNCGKKRVKLPLIGGHDSRLSILGCNDNFIPDNAHLRRFVRGTIFSLAVVATPPAAALALGLGIGLLPFAGIGVATYFIVKACKRRPQRRGCLR